MKALTGRNPISPLDNPVMSVISFLSQMADPGVVAAASGRSIAVMQKELRAQLEKGVGGASEEPPKDKENVKSEDAMEIDESSAEKPAEEAGSSAVIGDIASTAIATTAARASGLASHEERELTRLIGAGVNLTLQKFELKLAQFTEMEEILQAERRDLEKGRQQLFLDRLAFKKRVKDMEASFREATLKGPQEGMRLMAEALQGQAGSRVGFAGGNGAADGVDSVGEEVKSAEV
jgi:SWI/SNF related-matrix-associated actin-dependent regulator of chromatin subfamily C